MATQNAIAYFYGGSHLREVAWYALRTSPFPTTGVQCTSSGVCIVRFSLPMPGREQTWLSNVIARFPDTQLFLEAYARWAPFYAIGRAHDRLLVWTFVYDPWEMTAAELGVPLLLRDVVDERLRAFSSALSNGCVPANMPREI